MSDEIMLVFGEDGVAREYDDTWDITIHCESEEEQKAVLEKIKNSNQEAKNSTESSSTHKAIETVSRQAAIEALDKHLRMTDVPISYPGIISALTEWLNELPSAQPDKSKYEYHYDHTDCIWYRPEARNRCPSTCAQYRDGWNDAMQYIFRDGKGYRPYRRDKPYER